MVLVSTANMVNMATMVLMDHTASMANMELTASMAAMATIATATMAMPTTTVLRSNQKHTFNKNKSLSIQIGRLF